MTVCPMNWGVKMVRPTRRKQFGMWRGSESGMTLLELMLAAGVTTVSMVVLMASLMSVSTAHSVSADRALATAHVTTILEELHDLTYEQLLEYEPPSLTGLGASETITVACITGSGATITLPVGEGSDTSAIPNPFRVRVRISWVDRGGRPGTYTVNSMFRQ
ncbi:MAG: hypothetical protein HY706_19495 [Candidatus Hydrogenedentes bacterium]|nr:hypothetical protein [Candidatus Hydrogenedentota bacterium]